MADTKRSAKAAGGQLVAHRKFTCWAPIVRMRAVRGSGLQDGTSPERRAFRPAMTAGQWR